MPQPTKGDVHVNRPLTNILVAYVQADKNFVSRKVFPVVRVAKQSDRYFEYPRGQWFRDEMEKRAAGTESAGSGWEVDNTPTYYADKWALHKDVSDDERANADQPIDLDRSAAMFLAQKALIKEEVLFAAKYLTTGLWGSDFTPATKWDAAAGDPIADVESQKAAIAELTGFEPNKLVVTRDVHAALKNISEIIDRVTYTQKGVITDELLAALFEVDQYLVMRGVKNNAVEGAADDFKFIASDRALLCYAAPAPMINAPSAGYTFAWTGLLGAGAIGGRMKKFPMVELESDRVEIEMAFDQKLVAADCGIYINAPLT
jgi:hypothetical protein